MRIRNLTIGIIISLLIVGCSVSSYMLCVNKRLNRSYFVGTDKETGSKGLWLLKYITPTDSSSGMKAEAEWVLIFKDVESIASNSEYIIGRRNGYRNRFIIVTLEASTNGRMEYFRDSSTFVKARNKLGVPTSLVTETIEYAQGAPCRNDTAR